MKGLVPLFLGIFGTFAFSWVGLTVIPNWQIGHLNPQSDEEGTDIYPVPQSGMVERGRHVYAANGCIYCHSQQVRADYAGADIERKWGDRRSAPRDYIFERPVFLGKARMGQDIANIGARAPAEQPSPSPGGAAARHRRQEHQPVLRQVRSKARILLLQHKVLRRHSHKLPKLHHRRLRLRHHRQRLLLHLRQQQFRLLLRLRRQQLLRPLRRRQRDRHDPVHLLGLLRLLQEQSPRGPYRRVRSLGHRQLRRPVRRSQARHGRFKLLASRPCTPRHGTMCIFTRRAVSTLIRTCHPIVSFIERAASVTRVQQTL